MLAGVTLLSALTASAETVVAVHDGDTLTLSSGERVRLAETDAPELDQPYGVASRDVLRALLSNGTVTIDVIKRDRYGRAVAYVAVDGQDIDRAMIAAGAAWCYVRYLPPASDCPHREAVARAAHLGLWAAPDPIPPWEWRRQRAKK